MGLCVDENCEVALYNNYGNLSKYGEEKSYGTPLFTAPEQTRGFNYDKRVDFYSLGVTLFDMFMPYQDSGKRTKALQNLTKNHVFPIESDYLITSFTKYLINGLTEEDPDDRFLLPDEEVETRLFMQYVKTYYDIENSSNEVTLTEWKNNSFLNKYKARLFGDGNTTTNSSLIMVAKW